MQDETKKIIKRIVGILIALCIVIFMGIGGLFLMIGISPEQFDYEYDVGNGSYHLVRMSGHSIVIYPKEGYTNEAEVIPEKVVEIAWNERYVIAKQYGMKRKEPDKTYEIPDETIVNYWIMDTENKERYGPFAYEEFLNKLEVFNCSDLQLKPVSEYR